MEVKPGYKQTEVGVIPEDWEVKTLGELASVSAGGTPSRANAKYWNGDIPWITTSEVDFYTISHAEQFITKEGLNNSATKLFPRGTLLMALYGQGKTRGKVGILGIEAATNQACAAISLNRGVSGNYVFHFLGSQYEVIRNLSNTGNQENLNSSLVRSISILLPPAAEQEAIAEALSDADALIESLEQLIAKKRQIKQGAMQELLTGKQRLHRFANATTGYKQTEIGVIPDDWEVVSIGMLITEFRGGAPLKPSDFTQTGVKVLPKGGVGRTGWLRIEESELQYCSPAYAASHWRNQVDESFSIVVLRDLVPSGPSIGLIAQIRERETFVLAQGVYGFKVREATSVPSYLVHLSNTRWYRKMVNSIMVGSTQVHITNPAFKRAQIPLPSVPEQTAIAAILSDMDAEIAALEAKLTKARQLKQGMMQELLTGRIRLI